MSIARRQKSLETLLYYFEQNVLFIYLYFKYSLHCFKHTLFHAKSQCFIHNHNASINVCTVILLQTQTQCYMHNHNSSSIDNLFVLSTTTLFLDRVYPLQTQSTFKKWWQCFMHRVQCCDPRDNLCGTTFKHYNKTSNFIRQYLSSFL